MGEPVTRCTCQPRRDVDGSAFGPCEWCESQPGETATPDASQAVWRRFREDDSATWSAWEEWPDGFADVHDLLVWNACDGLHVWSRGFQTPPGTHFALPPAPPAPEAAQ